MKRLFSAAISITLVLGVFSMGQAGFPATVGSPALQRGRAAVRFVPRQMRAANRKLRYTVKAKYPQAVGAARDPRLAKLNQKLKALTAKEVADFTNDFQAPEEVLATIGSYYESEYKVTLATNDLVSVWFGVSTYFEGAAHPNHNSLVFNYDLNAGKALKLADLFKPNSNYLKVISDYAIKDLTKQLGPDPDTDWIQRGAGPEAENYKNWNLSRQGLEVNFDAYQVASYAEGPHEVVIPYSLLKDLIDSNGPLGRMQN